MIERFLKTVGAALIVGAAAVASAGDPEAGKAKAQQCASCHGANGVAISDQFPNLAGQYEDYLRHALKQYRSGKRNNAVMAAFAVNLSDQDIDDLAAYFSSQSGLDILPVK